MTKANPQWPVWSFSAMLERLPLEAQAKYKKIADSVADLQALTRLAQERVADLETRVAQVDNVLSRVSHREAADPDAVAENTTRRKHLIDQVAELQKQLSFRNSMRANAEQTLAQLRDIALPRLLGERAVPLRAYTLSASPNKGEDIKDAIVRIRADIVRIQHELKILLESPPSPNEIRASLVEMVDRYEREGTPFIDVSNGKLTVTFVDQPQYANPGSILSAPSGSATKMLCWLFKDRIFEALTRDLDQIQGGIAAPKRKEREAELRRQLLRLERMEESLVEQAIDLGLECHRRPTADPLAILGIAYAHQQMAAAESESIMADDDTAPPTSPPARD